MTKLFLTLVSLLFIFQLYGQNDTRRLINALLGETPIEEDLQELCDEIGGRVTGSVANEKAVAWAMENFNASGVKAWKDPFSMPVLWLAGATTAHVEGTTEFNPVIVAKYQTPPGTYTAKLLDLGMGTEDDFKKNAERVKGNIIILEADLCFDIAGLFAEYTHATNVEMLAYQYGARAVVFMSSRPRGLLYRFITMKGTENTLPQFVMAREDARRCLRLLREGHKLNMTIQTSAETGGSFQSHNVIAEIRGSEKPEEIVIIGAHLDSWALGTGANDNGCNVSMMIDIARQMKRLNIQPRRTIRFALWNGEEQGFFGSWDYCKDHKKALDNHLMALSVDIGSGDITGFFTNGRDELVQIVDKVLAPVDSLGPFAQINVPVVGTDNFDFMLEGVPNLIANHKPAFYGQNYHAYSDTYDKVDLEALKKNSAIVASLAMGFANVDDPTAKVLKRQKREEIQDLLENHNIEFSMRMFNVWESWINGDRGR